MATLTHRTPTPWGQSQGHDVVAPGITFHWTTSHGGFHVDSALLSRIRPQWRAYAKQWSGAETWYEEDCCAAFVVLEFSEHFSENQVRSAVHTVNWLRDRDLDDTTDLSHLERWAQAQ